MLTIISQPTEGATYLYDAIPDIEIDSQIPIGFSISIPGQVIYSHTYPDGQGHIFITGLGALILNYLILADTDYLITYMLNEDGDMGTAEYYTFTARRNTIAVDVVSEPVQDALYFQKSIPDIFLTKNVADSVTFELKKGTVLILSENYVFDTDGNIQIRNLGDIIEKYFSSDSLLLDFSYTITHDSVEHTISFRILKCDADMIVEAGTWTAVNFLTRSYLEKITSKSRNEYLSFLQKNSYSTVTKHFKIYYLLDNVVTELLGTLGTIAAVASDQVSTFNASMGALVTAAGLATDTEIIQYDIWITGTGLETAKYTFLPDYNQYRDRKNFVFVNCFGVLETFTATGRTDAKKTAELNLGNIENHYRKITQDFVNEKTINSGFLSAEEMEWLDDMILSFAVSTYTPGVTGSDEEITITNFEKTDTEANELQSFNFMIRRAKNNHLQFTNAAKEIFDITFDQTFN